MKKRIFSAVMSLCMLASVFCFATVASANDDTDGANDVYSLATAYSGDTTEGPVWFYMGKAGDEDWRDLYYYPAYGNNWQMFDNPEAQKIFYSLCEWGGVGAQAGYNAVLETNYSVAVVFQAPKDGDITIAPWRYVSYNNVNEDGSYQSTEDIVSMIRIIHNDEVLFTGKADGTLKANPALQVTVAAGDKIRFEIDPNGFDGTTILMNDIAVAYGGAALPEQAAIVVSAGEGTPDDQSAAPAEAPASDEASSEAPAEVSSEAADSSQEAVSSEAPSSDIATTVAPTSSGINGWMIGAILAVIVIAAAVIIIIVMKKKKK